MRKTVLFPYIITLVIISFLNLTVKQAEASMLSASESISQMTAAAKRQRLLNLLKEESVKKQLQKLGVPFEEASQRVAALSDEEISRINSRLDQLPAGKDGVGTVVGAVVFIFIVLLLTDLLGLTDVFPFVRK